MNAAHMRGAKTSRGVLAVVAAAAMTGAMAAPVAFAADGEFLAPGSVSSSPESKIQDGSIVGGAKVAPQSYFVQFISQPTVSGGSLHSIAGEREQFLSHVQAAGVELEVRSEFDTLWNGMSVNVAEADLLDLAGSDVVEAIFPVEILDAPTTPHASDFAPQLASALGMTGADVAHSELGFTGEGIKVAIMDTGIDYDHPDFGGSGVPGGTDFPTERVTHGFDFVGDSYNANPGAGDLYQPIPMPDEDPDDCQGHGTHVAGIVGANGETVGVAPDVTFGAYRVFGCDGSTDADIMMHAMEKALEDEMDILNMSIGSSFSAWREYPTAVAADALADEGVIVVASIGNSGREGLFSAGAPGVGSGVIGVGSVDNTEYLARAILNENGDAVPYTVGTPAPPPPNEGTVDLVAFAEAGSTEAQACGPEDTLAEYADLIEGNYVLIQRGVCTFYEKAFNAQAVGAAGVLLYNNAPGVINPGLDGTPPITIPTVMIPETDGAELTELALANGSTPITWSDEEYLVPNPTGGLISDFSSWGMMADMTIKPDLAAPGGSIFAPYPLEIQPYATLSGTSMASPHVAGAVALQLQADPTLTGAEAQTRLQNSSTKLEVSIAAGSGLLEPVHRQGTGMIRIDSAILAEVTIEPALIQLGQQAAETSSTQEVTLTNQGDTDVTYAVEHAPAVSTLGSATDWDYYLYEAAVEVQESVAVPAGGSVTVPVTITSPEDWPIFGGYVLFHDSDSENTYSVAYGGFAGDLQDTEVLGNLFPGTEDELELPLLGVVGSCTMFIGFDCHDPGASYDLVPEGYAYSMDQDDAPLLLVRLEHQARQLQIEAFEANADGTPGASVGVVFTTDYTSRDATAGSFRALAWDGRVADDNGARVRVADGDYVLELTATKAQAFNDDSEAQTEVYTSPQFSIEWGEQGQIDTPTVDRTSGHDRYATASELAIENFGPGVETVYVASGVNFPDALSGGALAGMDGAPVLLTKPGTLSAPTRLALGQLQPENIVLLGGQAAISEAVEAELETYAPVERLSGSDRYATAAEVSARYEAAEVVFLASGANFPDALSAAAAAGVQNAPVLLTRPDQLPSATAAELERLNPAQVVVIGGAAAVSEGVSEAAGEYAGEVVRVSGSNRYATAANVATTFFDADVPHSFVATGAEFADALATSPAAAKRNSPVLLVRQNSVPGDVMDALMELRAQNLTIAGGFGAVSLEVQHLLADIVYP